MHAAQMADNDTLYCQLQTRLEIGVALAQTKQYDDALDTLTALLPDFQTQNSLAFEHLLGEYHFWLGYVAFYLGDGPRAKSELYKADSMIFPIDKLGTELRARIRRMQGTVTYFIDANAFKAQNLYNDAYKEWLQIPAKDSIEYAVVLQCMGQAAGRLGEYDKSVDLYQQSLEIRERFHGKSHWRVGWTYWNLGNTQIYARNYEEAHKDYETALTILNEKTPEDYKTIGHITGNLAMCYYWLGLYDASITSFQKAISIGGKQSKAPTVEIAICYSNLAMAYAKQKQFAKSQAALAKAYEMAHQNALTAGATMAGIRENHAFVLNEIDASSEQALKMIQTAIWAIAPTTDTTLLDVYPSVQASDFPVLLQEFAVFKADLMLTKADLMPHNEQSATSRQHYLDVSLRGYELAAALGDRLRLTYEDQDDKLTVSNRGTTYIGDAMRCAYQLWTITKEDQYIARAFQLMERNKFQLLLELFQKSQLHVAGEFEDAALQELDQLRRRCNELDFLLSQPATPTDSTGPFRAELLKKRMDLRQLEDSLQRSSQLFKAVNTTQPLATLDSLLSYSQKSKLAVLSYTIIDSALFVIMAADGKATFRQSTLPDHFADSIAVWTKICRKLATEPQAIRTFARLGHAIYEILLGPEQRQLIASATELLIIPDGILSNLPFEALLTEAPRKAVSSYGKLPYMIRKYQIHYGASASLWLAQHSLRKDAPNLECLGVAWGDVGRASAPGVLGKIPALRGSKLEVEALQALVQGRYLYGQDATEAAFKTFAPQFGLLHLALHARADADPEILFPVVDDHGEDGILQFHELYQMRLKARLAVLSACETGVGELQQGEGIQSISSGFAAAGIPTLLVSLWELDDRSGMQIMKKFYEGIAAGQRVDQALRQAKLAYLETAIGYEASPYYWSTMVPLGNMEPISLQAAQGDYRWSILTGTGLLLCISLIYSIYKKKRKTT